MEDRELVLLEQEGYLEVRASGTLTYPRFAAMIETVARRCREKNLNAILFDVSGLQKDVLSIVDHFESASHAAGALTFVRKVAAIDPYRVFDPERFGTMVAQNRSLRVEYFLQRSKAAQWLTEPD